MHFIVCISLLSSIGIKVIFVRAYITKLLLFLRIHRTHPKFSKILNKMRFITLWFFQDVRYNFVHELKYFYTVNTIFLMHSSNSKNKKQQQKKHLENKNKFRMHGFKLHGLRKVQMYTYSERRSCNCNCDKRKHENCQHNTHLDTEVTVSRM